MKGKPQPAPWLHSEYFLSPSSFFEGTELVADSYEELARHVIEVQDAGASTGPLLWRGQSNSIWGLHSSLQRALTHRQGIATSWEKHVPARYTEKQSYPTEEDMQLAERWMLKTARHDWRFDNVGALEVFARIQHRGGPTRLIDFTFNPFIAAWFATNADADKDGRIFALATRGPDVQAAESKISLDPEWGGYQPNWHHWDERSLYEENSWGTGTLRRFWVPPAYDQRMLAQNSVFVLDGIPISTKKMQSSLRIPKAPKNTNWRIADIMASGSILMKPTIPSKPNLSSKNNLASVYNIRVTEQGKQDVRARLHSLFGYSDSSIYPDVEGLSQHLVRTLSTNEPL